jgi:hypothetical protein
VAERRHAGQPDEVGYANIGFSGEENPVFDDSDMVLRNGTRDASQRSLSNFETGNRPSSADADLADVFTQFRTSLGDEDGLGGCILLSGQHWPTSYHASKMRQMCSFVLES